MIQDLKNQEVKEVSCGQLGQFLCEYEKRRRDSFEELQMPKFTAGSADQYSFVSGADSDRSIESS